MAPTADSDRRIPIICVDSSTWVCAGIFNPNDWSGESRGVVQSCMTECSALHHCAERIARLSEAPERTCQHHIHSIQQQWFMAKFDVGRAEIYGEVPELHVLIEAWFSGLKSLLDLLVQLLSTEKIVNGVVDGFHRTQQGTQINYGGRVLNMLKGNASKDGKESAAKMVDLISNHKALWIDKAIMARDDLIHPQKGVYPFMFHLEFVEQESSLACVRVSPPVIGSEAVHEYAYRVLKYAHQFSSSILAILHPEAAQQG